MTGWSASRTSDSVGSGMLTPGGRPEGARPFRVGDDDREDLGHGSPAAHAAVRLRNVMRNPSGPRVSVSFSNPSFARTPKRGTGTKGARTTSRPPGSDRGARHRAG